MTEQKGNGLEIKEEYCIAKEFTESFLDAHCDVNKALNSKTRIKKKWVSVESLLKHKVRWRSDHKDRPVECVILLSESQVNELEDLKDEN